MKQEDRDISSRGQLIGLSFKEGGFMPCEDDEDLCDIGSGAGNGKKFWNIFIFCSYSNKFYGKNVNFVLPISRDNFMEWQLKFCIINKHWNSNFETNWSFNS